MPMDIYVDRAVLKMVEHWARRQGRGPTATACQVVLKLLGVDWTPRELGPGLVMPHASTGSVVHCTTRIGARVYIFHGVTIGRSDPRGAEPVADEGVIVEDDVIIGANAAVLFRRGQVLTIGAGTVVGANAVLLQSTGPGQVWAGNPAVRIK